MRILKFEGSTMREALSKVKEQLGDQAVVVSTRQVRRGLLGTGFEIAAAIDSDDDGQGPAPAATARAAPSARVAVPASDVATAIAPLKSELRSLRAMVRAGGDGKVTSALRSEVAELRKLVEQLGTAPAPASGPPPEPEARSVAPVTKPRADAPATAASTARIIALVGPTGVGKTTTIAKLAARAALAEGRRTAVITVDGYRVGGVDQIRTFTDLIGVPLAVVRDPAELADTVDSFADHELILIDTTGRSPRDAAAILELAATLHSVEGVEVHLTLAAATPSAIVDDLHRRYQALRPSRLLFTKLDEVDEAPELAHAAVRLGLPVTWIATGQQVPEDLEEPTAARIIELSGTAPSTHARSARGRYLAA